MNSLIFVGDATPVETAWIEAAKQLPVAFILSGVSVYLVVAFLKHIKEKDAALTVNQKDWQEMMDKWRAGYDEQVERSGVIINENSKALGEISACLRDRKA